MKLYKKLFDYADGKGVYGYWSVALSILSGLCWILPFWYLWKFLEAVLVRGEKQAAGRYVGYISLFMILYVLFYFFSLLCSHLLAFRIENNLRKKAAQHLLRASFHFYDRHSSGEVRKIIDDNAARTHMIVAHLIPDITQAFLIPLLVVGIMFAVDVRLGAMFVILIVVGALPIVFIMGESRFIELYMKSLERMNAKAVEYVRGMQVFKIFGTRIEAFTSFYDSIVSYAGQALDYSMSCRIPYVLFQIVFNIIIILPIPFAYFYTGEAEIIPGIVARLTFFACVSGLIFSAFMRIMYVNMYHFQAKTVVDKIEGLIEQMQEKSVSFGEVDRMESHDIVLQNVDFRYDSQPVFQNLSLCLEEGKTYALVGASGGGKSSLAKLIAGFYPLEKGDISIGGISLYRYTQDCVLRNISFVFQHAKLFKTSIYENVRLGNPKASPEEVLEALRLASCEDILAKFPEREHTLIGAEGVYLSGGETQRIAVARAILKKAPIVILDEAGAAADPENEYQMQQAFANLMRGKTVIMIAHRLSSIVNADEILVLYEGKIVERGSHQDLMEQGGKYKYLQESFHKANEWRVYA